MCRNIRKHSILTKMFWCLWWRREKRSICACQYPQGQSPPRITIDWIIILFLLSILNQVPWDFQTPWKCHGCWVLIIRSPVAHTEPLDHNTLAANQHGVNYYWIPLLRVMVGSVLGLLGAASKSLWGGVLEWKEPGLWSLIDLQLPYCEWTNRTY